MSENMWTGERISSETFHLHFGAWASAKRKWHSMCEKKVTQASRLLNWNYQQVFGHTEDGLSWHIYRLRDTAMKSKRHRFCPFLLIGFQLIAWSQEYSGMQILFCVCLALPGYLLSVWSYRWLHALSIAIEEHYCCSSPYPSSSTRSIFRKKSIYRIYTQNVRWNFGPRFPLTALYRVKREGKHLHYPFLTCKFSFDILEISGRGHLSRSSSSGTQQALAAGDEQI